MNGLQRIIDLVASNNRKEVRQATDLLVESHNELEAFDAARIAETVSLTGVVINEVAEMAPLADCASTGGLGSLTTLLTPYYLRAAGFKVPKISVPGAVDGAIDSLALLDGYRTTLNAPELLRILRSSGFFHVKQSEEICPADGIMVERRREIGAMSKHKMAAISLFAKKLAVPQTSVCFDFRVGDTGNLRGFEEARKAASFFLDTAGELGIACSIVLTKHQFPVCSAIGRRESLCLFGETLGLLESSMLEVDKAHVNGCRLMAASLAGETALARTNNESLQVSFASHLLAQGSNLTEFYKVAEESRLAPREELRSRAAGTWIPPTLAMVRQWFRRQEALLGNTGLNEVGLRLRKDPFTITSPGELLLEVKSPFRLTETDSELLSGEVCEKEKRNTEEFILEVVTTESRGESRRNK